MQIWGTAAACHSLLCLTCLFRIKFPNFSPNKYMWWDRHTTVIEQVTGSVGFQYKNMNCISQFSITHIPMCDATVTQQLLNKEPAMLSLSKTMNCVYQSSIKQTCATMRRWHNRYWTSKLQCWFKYKNVTPVPMPQLQPQCLQTVQCDISTWLISTSDFIKMTSLPNWTWDN